MRVHPKLFCFGRHLNPGHVHPGWGGAWGRVPPEVGPRLQRHQRQLPRGQRHQAAAGGGPRQGGAAAPRRGERGVPPHRWCLTLPSMTPRKFVTPGLCRIIVPVDKLFVASQPMSIFAACVWISFYV